MGRSRSPPGSLSTRPCWAAPTARRTGSSRGPRAAENRDAETVFVDNRYVSPDTWFHGEGHSFQRQVHYFVGGATKFYGAALYRMRERDLDEFTNHDGISPPWPIGYDVMEPYTEARGERLHPACHMRRVPLPGPCQGRCRQRRALHVTPWSLTDRAPGSPAPDDDPPPQEQRTSGSPLPAVRNPPTGIPTGTCSQRWRSLPARWSPNCAPRTPARSSSTSSPRSTARSSTSTSPRPPPSTNSDRSS